MKFKKVIAREDLPARYPFGVASFLLLVSEKVDSNVFDWIIMVMLVLIAAVVMFRQFGEKEVELNELHQDEDSAKEKKEK